MTKPIGVVWNPTAGSAETRPAQTIERELAERSDVSFVRTTEERDARTIAAELARAGARIVIGAGGDGTISEVARGLLDAKTMASLGILPTGTANDFARSLALPTDLTAAYELIDQGEPRSIDLVRAEIGEVRALCINAATGGNSARLHESLTEEVKARWGAWCYLRGAVDVIFDLVPFEIEFEFDEGPKETCSALNVMIGNGTYAAGGISIAPRARLDDGLMDVVIVRDAPAIQLAWLGSQVALGDFLENENVTFRCARSFTLRSDPEMSFSVDGEIFEPGPAKFWVEPSAIRVIAPTPEVEA